LKSSPLDFNGQRLGNTSLVVFLRFYSFSHVVKWPEFVRSYTTNILHIQCKISLTGRDPLCLREVLGTLSTGIFVLRYYFTFQFAFYQAKQIILEKTLNQNYYVDNFDHLSHLARLDLASFVWRNQCGKRCAMWYSTLLTGSFETIYMRFDGVSTLVIPFWLICTTRRWDRGSVGVIPFSFRN